MKALAGKLMFRFLQSVILAAVVLGFLAPRNVVAGSSPTITTQPQNQTNLLGANAIFKVAASGQTPLFYLWSFNGTNLTNSAHISGATNATLVVSNVAASDMGNYQVAVSNSHGSATSSNAMLTVLIPASITSQPTNQSVVVSNNATFMAKVVGTAPLGIQWYFSGTPLADGGRVTGSATTNLNLANVQSSDAGSYQLVVTNNYGVATSAVAILTVVMLPAIVMQPSNQIASVGNIVVFSVAATGTGPLLYQWQKDGVNLADGVRLGGTASPTLTISNVQGSDTGNYSITVSNLYGVAGSAPANLTVLPLVVWGATNAAPTVFSNAVAISAGAYNGEYVYLGLKSDSTVAGWGITVPAGLSNAVAVSAGYRHGLALQNNGTVVGFGDNSFGEISTPAGLSNVVDIAAGGDCSVALKSDGTIAGWGYTLPPAGLSNILTVSGGTFDSLALRDDDTVTGWGYNGYGEASAPAGLSNVVAVSAGAFHSLALKNDGTVVAWGYNYYGESTVPAGLSNVIAVAAGYYHSMVLKSDGTIVAWGNNDYGESNVAAGLTNVAAIAAAYLHSFALVPSPAAQLPPLIRWTGSTNRTIPFGQNFLYLPAVTGSLPMRFQWLFNNTPLLGATNRWLLLSAAQTAQSGNYYLAAMNDSGSVTSSIATLTVMAPAPPAFASQLSDQTVLYGSMAIFSNSVTGTQPLVYQWQENGTNLFNGGRLNGATGATLTISDVQMSDIGSYQLIVSNAYGMATNGAALSVVPVVAWGYNPQGQATVPLDFTNVTAVDADSGQSMALRSDGTVTVWRVDPYTVPPAGLSNVVAVAKGLYACLALTGDGTITGWGQNPSGQSVPPAGLANVVAISAGNDHSLALGSNGQVTDWGYYWEYYFSGVTPGGGMTNLFAISGRSDHSLAVREDGKVFGWGRNNAGQAAVPAGLSNVVAVSVGRFHSLVLKSDGTVFAWGYNYDGETNIPPGLSNVVEISAGDVHNLALRSDGTVVGWGDNSYGESSPPTVLSNVVSIDAGGSYSIAIVQNPTVRIPPTVWWQGTTNRVLTARGTTIFHPKVNGSLPMNFQWYFNGAPMAGQTNRWLALLSTSPQQSGNYYFTVSNPYGAATSMVATVSEAPAIVSPPVSQSIVLGSNVTFAASAVGDATLGYQWYFNGAPLMDGGRVSGSATTNLSLSNIQTSDGGPYQLVVTNNSGTVTSAVASLTVLLPATIAVQPTNRTVITGSNVTFSVVAGGTAPFGFLWYSNGIALASGGRISGATSTNLTIASVQTNDNGTMYQVLVTNNYGSITSAVAMLTVLAPVQIIGQPASAAVLLGGNVSFTVNAAGSVPMSYQWYFNGAPLSDGGRIAGGATPTLNISGVQSGDAGGYVVVITNSVSSATSLTGSLTPQSSLAPSVRYVALTCTNPMPPYLDWTNAATNIQDAVDAAVAGDLVLVSNGTYNVGGRVVYGASTNRVVVSKAVTVQSVNGPTATTISVFYNPAGTRPNVRCVYLTNNASLIGFTLATGGARTSGDVILEQSGGGVWCESSSAVVSNCVLSGNFSPQYGGGAFRGTLFNCLLTNNSGGSGGGACSNALFNCTLAKNVASGRNLNNGGGAMGCTLSNCLLVANQCFSAGGGGGAAFSTLVSCVVSNNYASQNGGGVFMSAASYSLISSNRAYLGGGAYSNVLTGCVLQNNLALGSVAGAADIAVLLGCTVVSNNPGIWGGTATNCIIFYNINNTVDTKSVAYSCTIPAAGLGPGDITNAPLFVNLAGGDYHLQSNSPCINSGLNAAVTVSNDFDGNPRIVGGTVDMGAYEYQTPSSILSYAYLQQFGLPTDGSVDYLDLDGTGMNNWQKWIAGLNPTNPASVLVTLPLVATNSATGVTVSWQSVNTRTYYIQRATNLGARPAFSAIQSNLVGKAGSTSFTDISATNGGPYFYRVGVQ
jgi:parallel beta-helix repeat protein